MSINVLIRVASGSGPELGDKLLTYGANFIQPGLVEVGVIAANIVFVSAANPNATSENNKKAITFMVCCVDDNSSVDLRCFPN